MIKNNVLCLICNSQSDKYLTVTDLLYGIDGEWTYLSATTMNVDIFSTSLSQMILILAGYYSENYYSAAPPQIDFNSTYKKNRGVWIKLNYLKYF